MIRAVSTTAVDVAAGAARAANALTNRRAEALKESAAKAIAHAMQSESELHCLFDHAPTGMAIVSLDGRCARVNRALRAFLGRPHEELEGRRLDEVAEFVESSEGATLEGFFHADRVDWEGELRVAKPDGAAAYGVVTIVVRRSANGEPRHFIAHVADVTAARQAEEEHARMELELRLAQNLEAVGQLAAGIAHEINTPIQFVGDSVRFVDEAFTDILGLLKAYARLEEALAQGQDPSAALAAVEEAKDLADLEYLRERVPAALTRSIDGAERVAHIVKAMRTFAHPPTTEKGPVDVNNAIENTLVVARNEYKYVADVETRLGELPFVMGNAGDLNQVLLNLVVNAAHAIQDRVGDSGERGRITIGTEADGDHVRLTVSDTGSGIPAEVANRIFEPFFTTKEVGRGTGQGLAIVRTIVTDGHGGTISFDTEPGAGTTFCVCVPVAG